jgi:hypothetical protein
MGFDKKSFMPAASHCSRSPASAFPVKAMTATCGFLTALEARNCRVASKPSISGIWQSINTTSKSAAQSACKASMPLLTQ